MHVRAPRLENAEEAHKRQDAWPDASWKCAASHSRHEVALERPSTALYDPGGQGDGAEEPVGQ